MKEFLSFILSHLVEHPEEMDIRQGEDGDVIYFIVSLRDTDAGRVIGKRGRTINALRNVLSAAASKHGKRVLLEIAE